ncbi:DNA-3-methyladenine glycosylase [Haloferula rosea]|uniref:Putative 3-methyladenine DNA glycosylase n=1 Tax=Haloferula rosea TaxID=490093 RepID=A0A934RFD9_9BACT|nr:DNA-3-methyladenine glycosylase [Haloferula rosea]MBK1828507.1 DNA-3-methyladenine glycosylase [Haloferula rosea]
MRAGVDFFDRHHLDVARELIGSRLEWDGCAGVIVETEGYGSEGDEACHTFFRRSARQFFEEHGPGTVYAYINYGIYWLLNVLAKDGIVLIRALEPVDGLDEMRRRRGSKMSDLQLCSGPGKLGISIGLGREDHGSSLVDHPDRRILTRPEGAEIQVASDIRVGISKATTLPWRFLMKDSPHVSVRHGRVRVKS